MAGKQPQRPNRLLESLNRKPVGMTAEYAHVRCSGCGTVCEEGDRVYATARQQDGERYEVEQVRCLSCGPSHVITPKDAVVGEAVLWYDGGVRSLVLRHARVPVEVADPARG